MHGLLNFCLDQSQKQKVIQCTKAKGQLISGWLLDVFIWTKNEQNISVFLPYLSKIGRIQKRMQIIILEDK